ncbi:lipoprotein B [Salinisphaera orenii MK-B5]|uniref:Lipoprotein B n=1 Tax=Salinisphaera orenii MK-B5 TaxID=856730 RepID=A0A423PXH6_9GAMM|nr:YqaA family protein [Salinisphaera orenii]ROO30318.1 lipoprotein B [Salinisphaera orenii MK-B5]
MFRRLYDLVVRGAGHPRAPTWLGVLSFAESSFFPIPPDVMLAPMVLADRRRAWWFALIATVGSVLGGMLGYLIGALFLETLLPWLRELGYYEGYATARDWFADYGFWAVLLAGFSPIPYKVFTIAAGAVAMPFVPFALGSLIGRGARFFIVAGLVRWFGPVFEQRLLKYIDWIGWAIVAAVFIAVAVYQLR